MSLSFFHACASSDVHTQKLPSADLWTYHTYAWPAEQAKIANATKQRADLDLARLGMIPVPYTGNPDAWISQVTTQSGVALEFRDAHTGQTYWKGETRFDSISGIPSQSVIESTVDTLVHRYVSDQDWKDASWWLSPNLSNG